MKKAFTLAEIMIVLTIIGILTAILLPSAFQSTPDENVMKFKKANSVLGTVVRELVSSDKYYKNGDLGVKADDTQLKSETSYYKYFCESMADILSVKSKNCSDGDAPAGSGYVNLKDYIVSNDLTAAKLQEAKAKFDEYCAATQRDELITADSVTWWQVAPKDTFGEVVTKSSGDVRVFTDPTATPHDDYKDQNGFDAVYKTFCFDVDGINTGEAPFGYGIRADGKLLPGARADEWMAKSIQNKD